MTVGPVLYSRGRFPALFSASWGFGADVRKIPLPGLWSCRAHRLWICLWNALRGFRGCSVCLNTLHTAQARRAGSSSRLFCSRCPCILHIALRPRWTRSAPVCSLWFWLQAGRQTGNGCRQTPRCRWPGWSAAICLMVIGRRLLFYRYALFRAVPCRGAALQPNGRTSATGWVEGCRLQAMICRYPTHRIRMLGCREAVWNRLRAGYGRCIRAIRGISRCPAGGLTGFLSLYGRWGSLLSVYWSWACRRVFLRTQPAPPCGRL